MDAKADILAMLSSREGEYISGQELSERLGFSRTAVWKHIRELRESGYTIESVKKSGYRLVARPNTISAPEIQSGLHTENFGCRVHYEESVASTQKIAHQLASEGAPEGTLVVADEQTGGRGRLGRPWHSPKGTGIWASLVLRPHISPQQAPQLTLLAAVGVVKGMKAGAGLDCDIKWPNDILCGGKKLVGILTELQADPDQVHSVIVGMGMNVNTKKTDFPEELRDTATSVCIETGQDVHRAFLLQNILRETERLYTEYLREGFRFIKLLWESYAVSLGNVIQARTLQGTLVGRAMGLNDSGFLILEDEHGKRHEVSSADIELPSEKRT
ncbi:MAG TPA: biotin--[acetyl-CoA-carboxylase] ligase [Bacillales bacterium]|nr:biotin--[acetyl-CoA-carboxylase] ligase [Bacillales bacterium]